MTRYYFMASTMKRYEASHRKLLPNRCVLSATEWFFGGDRLRAGLANIDESAGHQSGRAHAGSKGKCAEGDAGARLFLRMRYADGGMPG